MLPEFLWSVGEEGSDPWVSRSGQPHRIDQLAMSHHLDHQSADLKSIAGLHVNHVRYGMPWRLAETSPGIYDWSLWDRALDACEEAGLEPIIDLLHFGLPDYCKGLADPDWMRRFVDYTAAFVARYNRPLLFTGINEPAFHAITAGYLGIWNDQLQSEQDYVRILANLTLANLEALNLIRQDREAWWVGAETYNIPVAVTPDAEELAERQRALAWLVWDWHLGVEPTHFASELLEVVPDTMLERIGELAIRDRLLAGHDLYPGNFQFIGGDERELSIDARLALYEADARRWYDRYEVPFWISETSNFGLPVEAQIEWLDKLVACLVRLRSDGIPANGLCWYSRGDQYDWATLLAEPSGQVTEVGLFDASRNARPVAEAFARHVREGVPAPR